MNPQIIQKAIMKGLKDLMSSMDNTSGEECPICGMSPCECDMTTEPGDMESSLPVSEKAEVASEKDAQKEVQDTEDEGLAKKPDDDGITTDDVKKYLAMKKQRKMVL